MTLRSRTVLGIGMLVVALSVTAIAHHGQAGLFDDTRTVELKGSVKKWSFVNPHPILLLEVTDEKGVRTNWDIYFGPSAVAFLRRQGYTPETFRVGETVIVKGHPATGEGTHGMDVFGRGATVTRADGTKIP